MPREARLAVAAAGRDTSQVEPAGQKGRLVERLVMGGAIVCLVILVVLPILSLFASSLWSGSGLTLENFEEAVSGRLYIRALQNSLILGAWTGLFSLLIGLPMAWAVARTNVPMKPLVRLTANLSYLSPPFLTAIAFVNMFSPNAGVINAAVLSSMNDGAIVVNYDRGEIVDAAALDKALASGKVRYAAIDADIFRQADGKITGPMAPYLEIEAKHRGKLELLPHAAADTEHVSRVEGAKQAVDQIFDVIQLRSVTNLKGDLPAGYTNAGPCTVKGVGKVTPSLLSAAAADPVALAQLRSTAEEITALWGAIGSTTDPDRRQELIDRHGPRLVKASNAYDALMERLGLKGPWG